MSLWIGGNSLVKGLKNQGVANDERHDSPVVEVQNCAQIEFMLLRSDVILELHRISEPASTIFIFSSALYLLRLEMTTPPIEDFSNSLSSIGGAYQITDTLAFVDCTWGFYFALSWQSFNSSGTSGW